MIVRRSENPDRHGVRTSGWRGSLTRSPVGTIADNIYRVGNLRRPESGRSAKADRSVGHAGSLPSEPRQLRRGRARAERRQQPVARLDHPIEQFGRAAGIGMRFFASRRKPARTSLRKG